MNEYKELFLKIHSNAEINLADYKNKSKSNKVCRWTTAVASTAAVMALSTGILMANPVLASKIPIIGKIFERVEDNVTYSGEFKDNADILTSEDEAAKADYVVENNGVQITTSEIYCDGYSVFLTAKIEVAKGGLADMMSDYASRDTDGAKVSTMYTNGKWEAAGTSGELMNDHFEGEVVDDKTFVGIIKVDLGNMASEGGTFNLDLSFLGYDSNANHPEVNDDKIGLGQRFTGSWNLTVPYTVDTANTKIVAVDAKSESGFGIEKVLVSPYQVVVYSDVPYKTDLTKEEFEEMFGEWNKGLVAFGDEPVKYEDVRNEKHYEHFDMALYNQDNEKLDLEEVELNGETRIITFPTKGLNISKLYAFMDIMRDEDSDIGNAQDINEAKEKAVFNTEIDIK
jgi:hypothetical protein